MATNLFPQTVVAFVWDFDKTLIPHYMQTPLFRRFNIDEGRFWDEVKALEQHYLDQENLTVNTETIYLNHLLTYVTRGEMAGLTNAVLRECGSDIEFFPGLPDFFPRVKESIEGEPGFKRHGITVEHYIVSTGFRQMILGSAIAPYVEHVWGCEFLEEPAPPGFLSGGQAGIEAEIKVVPLRSRDRSVRAAGRAKKRGISQVAYAIDNTTKTRALFEINKGSNVADIDVNAVMAAEDRRVPFENMVYIADGPSDVPVFSVLNKSRGHTYGVYGPGSPEQFRQVKALQEQGRIQSFSEADYSRDSQASLWLSETAREIASRIAFAKETALHDRVLPPPKHITEVQKEQSGPGEPGLIHLGGE